MRSYSWGKGDNLITPFLGYVDELKELAASILREGLIEPIVVRRKESRYEIIAGERRFHVVRDYTEMETIPSTC